MMKIYSKHNGKTFFFSMIQEERLKKIRELLMLYNELGLIKRTVFYNFDWADSYGLGDSLEFIDRAEYLNEGEAAVLKKFGIEGLDVYEKIEDSLKRFLLQDFDEYTCECYCNVPDEKLRIIKSRYVELFGEEEWKRNTKR